MHILRSGRVPCSPTLKSSYASHVTTPPASLLQHHFMTLLRTYNISAMSCYVWPRRRLLTMGSVNINSCSRRAPLRSAPFSMLKKFLMNVRAALGSDAGLKGSRRKGISRARSVISKKCVHGRVFSTLGWATHLLTSSHACNT